MRITLRTSLILLCAVIYLIPWYFVFSQFHNPALVGIDIRDLLQAGRAVWALQNPYQETIAFYSPPWMLFIIAPLSLLPGQSAFILWTLIGIAAYLTAFRRMGMDWSAVYVLLFSPFVVGNLVFGNYDWLVLLGGTLVPTVGIWFLAVKPQLGVALAGLWAWRSFKISWRSFLLIVLPILMAFLLSFIFGYRFPDPNDLRWSKDIWPWGIPIGMAIAFFAYRRQDLLLSLAAAPFLSPYVSWHSWIVVLLPLSRNRWALAAGIVASWFYSAWALTH
jgi:hypothetical protein